jgi:DNA polymerase-1
MIYFIGQDSLISSDLYTKSTVKECLAYFKDISMVEVDTETTGSDCHRDRIISLQLGNSERQYVIDTRVINILLFKDLLESKLCILQNAKFDYKMLYKRGIVLDKIYDTMLAEVILYTGYEKWGYGLDKLCERYCGVKLDKSVRGSFLSVKDQPFTDVQIQYAALDVAYLSKIRELQLVKIRKYDLEYCLNLENQVVKALADIEFNGMYLNTNQWLKMAKDNQASLIKIENELDNIILNDPILSKKYKPQYVQTSLFEIKERELSINYSSPLQMKKIFSILGYNLESTGDRELSKLVKKHKFFELLSNQREVAKIVSTYGEGFLNYINKTTGRVHTSFWQILNTGRVSSGSKHDNSPNLQNIPADNKFRNCFQVEPGNKWISIDYSAQEMRLMANGSGEEGFIGVLNSGKDIHCYAGSMMFGREIDPVKDKPIRTKVKTINFGKAYGMGTSKLADSLSIPIEESEELFKLYSQAFPRLNSWLKHQGDFAKNNMYSTTFAPCKRRRWYPEMKEARELRKIVQKGDKDTWRKIMIIEGQTERNGGNQPIQGKQHCPG